MGSALRLFVLLAILLFVAPERVFASSLACVNGTCPNDEYGNAQCCSRWGFCGNTTAYCRTVGCQSGPCIPPPNPDDERCIVAPCNDDTLCCSLAQYCGTNSSDYCGVGCTSGPCYNNTPPAPTRTGGCLSGNTCIDPSFCCSSIGYCGDNSDYCGLTCVGGPCWNNITAPPVIRHIVYSTPIAAGLGVVVGLCIILAISAGLVLAARRSHFARHGPFYCGVIITGVIMSYMAAIIALSKQTDALCEAFPWFLGIAFVLVYGCLFIKTWVIYGMFRRAAALKRVVVEPFYIFKILGLFLAIEVIFLVIWSIVDPPRIYYLQTENNSDFYEIQCRTKTSRFWIIFLVYKAAWLVFGAVLCFLMRKVTKEYNKSRGIAYSIYNNVVLILLAAPLSAILMNVQYAMMVIEVVGIVCSFTFTLFILNFSVWYKIFYARFDVVAGMLKTRANSSSTTTTSPSTYSEPSQDATLTVHSSAQNSSSSSSSHEFASKEVA